MRVQCFDFSSAFVTTAALTCLPAVGSAQLVRPTVQVMLQNEAKIPADLVERAGREVARLFSQTDIDIQWMSEVPAGTRLRVVSVTTWEPSEQKVEASVLGYTQVAPGKRGTRGYVFWRRVERASQKFTASLDKVLAVAIAHELGHMLLPNGKHAKWGLMVAPWDASHFRSASAGLLAFHRTRRRSSNERSRRSVRLRQPPIHHGDDARAGGYRGRPERATRRVHLQATSPCRSQDVYRRESAGQAVGRAGAECSRRSRTVALYS